MLFKQKLFLVLTIILSLSFTSCIDIIEEITINKDKSGKVYIRVSAGMLGSMLSMASAYVDTDIITEVKTFPQKKAKELKKIKGISKVKAVNKLSSGIVGIKFNFNNNKALNKAYYKLLDQEKKWYYPSIVKVKKHKLKKRNLAPIIRNYVKKNQAAFKDVDVLKKINYKVVYNFPAEVKKVKNSKSKIIKKKRVIQKHSIHAILNSDVNIGNKIKY